MKKYILVSFLLTFSFFIFNTSHAEAATLYYNAAVDTDWNTLGNWWEDDAFSVSASALPTAGDDVIVEGDVVVNSGDPVSVNSATLNGSGQIAISFTVTDGVTFNDTSFFSGGTITGNAIFNGTSYMSGTITGDVIFNDASYNNGSVEGNAIFNSASAGEIILRDSQVWGIVSGTVKGSDDLLITEYIFNNDSVNSGGVLGNAVFNNSTTNSGTISGNAIFNNESINSCQGIVSGNAIFNDSSFNGNSAPFRCFLATNEIVGTAIFNDSSHNAEQGMLSGDATFNGSSYNVGTVSGDATFNDLSSNIRTGSDAFPPVLFGTVSGSATFNNTSHNDGIIGGNAIFNNSSYNNVTGSRFSTPTIRGTVSGSAIFNNLSYNSGIVSTNASFFDLTINNYTVSGNAEFYDSSTNGNIVSGDACFATTADQDGGSVGGLITTCAASLSTVDTSQAFLINSTAAVLGGEITDTGDESASEVGFEYGLTEEYEGTVSDTGTFIRGTFGIIVSSLACGSTYHYRAFAANSLGTSYGDDATFTAPACGTDQILYGVDSASSNDYNLYTLDSSTGNILTTIGSIGDYITGLAFNSITGVLYGSSTNNASNPKSLYSIDTTTGAGTYLGTITDGGATEHVMGDIAFRSDGRLYGMSGNSGVLYTINISSCDGSTCLATEVGDTGLSSWSPFGNGLAFDSSDNLYFFGYGDDNYWQIDPDTGEVISENTFTNPSGSSISLGAAKFNKHDTLFAARTYGSSPADLVVVDLTGNTIISLGEDNPDMIYISAIAFSPSVPVVNTSSASSVTRNEATLEGEIVNTGGTQVTERGFEWGSATGYDTTITEASGPYGVESFSATVSGLLCGRTYRYRAYAVSITGTGYGEDTLFETRDCAQASGGSGSSLKEVVNTPTAPTTPAIPSAPTCSITRTLMRGSTGDEVKCLQQGLNQRLNTNLVIDGIFGPLTQAAVIRFQLANSLKGDGIFGILSRGAWNK